VCVLKGAAPLPPPLSNSIPGRAILFVKGLGWTDADVSRRLLPCHCALLAREEAELAAVVDRLKALEIEEERVGVLVGGFAAGF
jgi:hypothetical protein